MNDYLSRTGARGVPAFVCALLAALTFVLPSARADVLTFHNDLGRTGANLQETALSPSSVNAAKFGKLYTLPVTGMVYAQPLYVAGLATPAGTKNVLYVATMHNKVYAFDADD